jgi:transcriptional regulator with XRE-family HTH domain
LARGLGRRLRELRHEAGFTQEHIALELKLSSGFVALMESGARLPSLGVLAGLASALGCDLLDLLAIDTTNPLAALLDAVRRREWEKAERALAELRARTQG